MASDTKKKSIKTAGWIAECFLINTGEVELRLQVMRRERERERTTARNGRDELLTSRAESREV